MTQKTPFEEQLVSYLTDVHSTEENALTYSSRPARRWPGHPRLAEAFREHLTKTQEQESLARGRPKAHDAEPSKLKDAAQKGGAMVTGTVAKAAPDTTGKLAIQHTRRATSRSHRVVPDAARRRRARRRPGDRTRRRAILRRSRRPRASSMRCSRKLVPTTLTLSRRWPDGGRHGSGLETGHRHGRALSFYRYWLGLEELRADVDWADKLDAERPAPRPQRRRGAAWSAAAPSSRSNPAVASTSAVEQLLDISPVSTCPARSAITRGVASRRSKTPDGNHVQLYEAAIELTPGARPGASATVGPGLRRSVHPGNGVPRGVCVERPVSEVHEQEVHDGRSRSRGTSRKTNATI